MLQLEKVSQLVLADLTRRTSLLPARACWRSLISTRRKGICSCKKQGVAFGHTKIQGKSLLVRGAERAGRVITMNCARSLPVHPYVRLLTQVYPGRVQRSCGQDDCNLHRAQQATEPLVSTSDSANFRAIVAALACRSTCRGGVGETAGVGESATHDFSV